ncbi:hypothetical protein AVDCRST_MAG94-2702 [uncultured Leptolyngbya sp.]|uniref:Uncharacterized protein n=1 Tax=uncultured Leptolyngbya sp. TaxID=332963 RepID=A0A6J4M632_9CYAN|nr:hypothetical protein AVDCRST_MAG94-2702 [uncultured Leptolyngbya sp.]
MYTDFLESPSNSISIDSMSQDLVAETERTIQLQKLNKN